MQNSIVIWVRNLARQQLAQDIRTDSEITEIVNTELTSFRTSIGIGSDSNVATLISEAESRLENQIRTDSEMTEIVNTELTSFRTSIGVSSDSSVGGLISEQRQD